MNVPPAPPPLSAARLAGICGVGFLVLASYSVARPPIESLYLEAYGRDQLPLVWLAVALVSLITVAIYNRFAAVTPLSRLFVGVCAVSVGSFLLVRGAGYAWPGVGPFLQYVWKDIYIVVLVEIFWSFANVVFKLERARWLYGVFLLAGTGGSFTGNVAVGWLANVGGWGSAATVWLVVPILTAAALLFFALTRGVAQGYSPARQHVSFSQSFAVLRGNRYLGLMVALICITQIVITLIDYTYNGVLQASFPDADERTQVIGQVYAAIDLSAVVMQAGSGLIMRGLGVGGTLLLIPGALALSLLAWGAFPRFATMAVSKIASKAFDYSIFRTAKELLYLPLSYAEKTQGKAVVDILTYRTSKALVSLMLLGLSVLQLAGLEMAISMVAVVLWLGITTSLVRRYRQRRADIATAL